MTKTPQQFKKDYLKWLDEEIVYKQVNETMYTEIITPFMDNNNDSISIYYRILDNKIYLTDDGSTISNLMLNGVDINSSKRKHIFHSFIKGFGIKSKNEELYVEATNENFPYKKHILIQSIISINDMFMLSSNRISSMFIEDVEKYLDDNDVRHIPAASFNGISGLTHSFEFVIPKSKNSSERFIKTINNPTKDQSKITIFSWNDVNESRKKESKLLVFLNDKDKSVGNEVMTAFNSYNIISIPWGKRDDYLELLTS